MSFNYDPKDAEAKLIPDGEYDAEVIEVEEQTSKAGNAMLKLTVKVWANGGSFHVFDYVVNPATLWKLKQLSSAVGLMDKFQTGSMNPRELVGKSFIAGVKTKKDETGKYAPQNVIAKYASASASASAPARREREPGADDLGDINF